MNRKLLMASCAVALALMVSGCDQAKSQGVNNPERVLSYVVQDGDTVSGVALAKNGDGTQYSELAELNPYLKEPARNVRSKGKYVILIYPGEIIRYTDRKQLEEAGINLAPGAATDGSNAAPSKPLTDPNWLERSWAWIVGLLLLGGVLYLAYRWREAHRAYRDPVGSGPAMVKGGVTDETVAQTFAERGETQARRFTIVGEVVRGKGYGDMLIRFRDGREEHRLLNGHVLYRATVRYEDADADEQIFMLQGCGNDARNGVRYSPEETFRFKRDAVVALAPQPPATEPEAVASAPEPEPAPAPVAAVEPPAPAALPEAEGSERTPKLKIELRPAEGDKGSLVRITGASTEHMTVELFDDELVLRHQPPTKVESSPEAPAAAQLEPA